jgi:hypothetical protein
MANAQRLDRIYRRQRNANAARRGRRCMIEGAGEHFPEKSLPLTWSGAGAGSPLRKMRPASSGQYLATTTESNL